MKNIIVVLGIITFLLTSCTVDEVGEGDIITTELTLNEFSGIESLGDFNVTVTRGAVQKVEVTGHSNIIEKLKTTINNNIWKIDLERGNYKNAELSFHIVLPTLSRVVLDGSGSIKINDFYSNENVFIAIYGSGTIDLKENEGCENLDIKVIGSGNIYADEAFENLKKLDINIVGSGGYSGFATEAVEGSFKIEGSGICKATVKNELNVDIFGSGNVLYKGTPIVNSKITGSGSIKDYN